MPELEDLENELSALRRELAAMSREGCTPTQFLRLQRELVRAWAAIEDCKSRRMPGRLWPGVGESAGETDSAPVPQGAGRKRK